MQGLGVPAKSMAAAFALAAFAVAVVAGLAAGNGATAVLTAAIASMIACYLVGFVVGLIAEHVIAEHLNTYRKANPIPDSSLPTDDQQEERPPANAAGA